MHLPLFQTCLNFLRHKSNRPNWLIAITIALQVCFVYDMKFKIHTKDRLVDVIIFFLKQCAITPLCLRQCHWRHHSLVITELIAPPMAFTEPLGVILILS